MKDSEKRGCEVHGTCGRFASDNCFRLSQLLDQVMSYSPARVLCLCPPNLSNFIIRIFIWSSANANASGMWIGVACLGQTHSTRAKPLSICITINTTPRPNNTCLYCKDLVLRWIGVWLQCHHLCPFQWDAAPPPFCEAPPVHHCM